MAPLVVVLLAVIGTAVARNYGAQQASLIEAEHLIGMDVKNSQGEKLGQIEEIVLDRDRSRIVYAVVASGGFLGFGERSVAVPWSAFQMPASTTSSDSGSTGSTAYPDRSTSGSTGSTHPGSTGSQGSQSQGSTQPKGSTRSTSSQPSQREGDMGSVAGVERSEPYLWHGDFLVLDIDVNTLKQAAFDENGTWPASADAAVFSGRSGMESGTSSGSSSAEPNRSSTSGQNPGQSPEDNPGHQPGRNPGHEPGKSPGHDPYKSPGHAKDQPAESGQTSTESGASTSTRASAQGQLVTVPDDPDFWSYKLSKLINLDVRNTQGEEIGGIEKILLDAREGRIAYATLSTEGYLQEGNRLATVEWNTVTVDPANDRLMIEADRQTLTRLAFIEGQEPDPALSGTMSSSTSTYGRPEGYGTSTGTSTGIGTSSSASGRTFATQLVDADQLLGIDVKNRNGEKLGEVEEIVLAREHEDIAYAVVAVGGVLETGGKKAAVPWQAFELASSDTGTRSTGASSTDVEQREPSTMHGTDPKDHPMDHPMDPNDIEQHERDSQSRDERDKSRSQNPADTRESGKTYGNTPSSTTGTSRTTTTAATQGRIDHLILDVDKANLEKAAFNDDGTWPESANLALFSRTVTSQPTTGMSSTGMSSTGMSSDTQKQQEPDKNRNNKNKDKAKHEDDKDKGYQPQQGSASTAQQQHEKSMGHTETAAADRTTVPNDPNFWSYKLSKLKDLDVRTAQGEELGDIDKVMIDAREGRMAYVIVEAGDLLTSNNSTTGSTGTTGGTGTTGSTSTDRSMSTGKGKVVVPWRVVSVSPTDERLIVKADRATLQAALIRGEEEPNLNDPLIAQRIEGAFGENAEEGSQVFGRPTTGTTPGIERFGHLDFNNTQTMTGTVKNVDRARPEELMIMVDTDQGKTVQVFAGPSDYAQKQGMSFTPQSKVTIVGVPAQTSATGTGNQEPVFVAKEIRADGRTLILFDNQGNPRWNTTNQNANPNKTQNPSDMNKDKNKDD
jgi:sporulation protein YlmC with PRC-barrel domain